MIINDTVYHAQTIMAANSLNGIKQEAKKKGKENCCNMRYDNFFKYT